MPSRIRIIGDHPHKGSSGTVRDDKPMKRMWEVELDDSWTTGRFVEPKNLRALTSEEDPKDQ